MKPEKVNISLLKINPENPRLIKDEKFKQLVKSIQDFPQMLELRPIVLNNEMMVLGARLRKLGYKRGKKIGKYGYTISKTPLEFGQSPADPF